MAETASSMPGTLIRDPLTGAYSRALLEERLPEEVERARRYGMSLSLCIFDIDHLKNVNTAYGHKRGDLVLRELAHRVQLTIRISDIFFRHGDDEFLLILPNTHKEHAIYLAQRIQEVVQATPFSGKPPIMVSISLGIASFPEDVHDKDTLFQLADHRCDEARRRGGGVAIWEDKLLPCPAPIREASLLIEREEALERLRFFLDQLPEKRRGVLCVSGRRGAGRSRLLAEAAALGRQRNYEIIALNGAPEIKTKPYGALLTAGLEDRLAVEAGVEGMAYMLGQWLTGQKCAGLLITIDNLAELDLATLDWLRLLLTVPPVDCIAAVYAAEPDSARALIHPSLPLIETILLKPLSPAGVRVWVQSSLRWQAPETFLDWLYLETGGLPALIQRNLTYLIERGLLQQTAEEVWEISPKYTTLTLAERLVVRPDKQRAEFAVEAAQVLPSGSTEFVGREYEREQLSTLLQKSRLVTIVGPGGIGKTRLALQAATAHLNDFADGAHCVALAALDDPDLLASAIARLLNIHEAVDRPLIENLKIGLRDKHMLLVLDHFEQVTEAAPLITDLLAAAPRLTILVTSRQPLRLSGEHILRVPPLAVPRVTDHLPLEALNQYDAVALFVTSAQAIRFDFRLTDENMPAILELCARLDGLSLAIELVAAHIDRLTPQAMLAQGKFAPLAGPRDATARHHTLRAAIEWSYQQLTHAERHLFACLSIFAGSFEAAAAEAVCNCVQDLSVSLGLQRLVAGNLLHRLPQTTDGSERYLMPVSIREYALECLAAGEAENSLRRRHATCYLHLAEQTEMEIGGPRQTAWLDRLEQEHINLRAALRWMLANDAKLAAQLAAALGNFWEIRGYWKEGRAWLEKSLARTPAAAQAACLCQWIGRLARRQGDYQHAMAFLQEALALCRQTNDRAGEAASMLELGWVAAVRGDYAAAQEAMERSLALYREAGDQTGLATVFYNLGCLSVWQTDYARAAILLKDSLLLNRELGNKAGVAATLRQLGQVAGALDEYAEAEASLEESAALSRELDDREGLAQTLRLLAETTRARGNYRRARECLEEWLAICEALQDNAGTGESLRNLAELARSQQDFERATYFYHKYMNFSRATGNKMGVARTLKDLGEIARYQGKYEQAKLLYQESLILLQKIGDRTEVAWTFRALAEAVMQEGDYARAKALLSESLAMAGEHTPRMLIVLALSGLAAVAEAQGQWERAARLLGASEALYTAQRAMIAVDDRRDYERRTAAVRNQLNPARLAAAWTAGQGMTLAEALAYACESE